MQCDEDCEKVTTGTAAVSAHFSNIYQKLKYQWVAEMYSVNEFLYFKLAGFLDPDEVSK